MKKYQTNSKKRKIRPAEGIFFCLLIFCIVLLIHCAYLLFTYAGMGILCVFSVFIAAILAVCIFARKKHIVLSFVLLGLTFTALLAISLFGGNIDGRISKIEAPIEYETIQIAALRDRGIEETDDFTDFEVAYVMTEDGVYDRFSGVLQSYEKNVGRSVPYERPVNAYKALTDKKRDLIVLTNYVRTELAENNPAYMDDLEILIEESYPIGMIQDKSVDVAKEPFTIYLQGIDYSAKQNINSAARGDVNILLTVNPVTERVNMQVIPRDTYVYVESLGKSTKLSYSGIWGGTQSSINSIENKFDIDINYYAKINFQGMIDLVDALGGIEVYSHYTYSTQGCNFNEGMNHVDGERALIFARTRKILPNNELDRGVHQMEIVKGIFAKFAQKPDYSSAMAILDTVSENFATNIPKKDYRKMFNIVVKLLPELKNMQVKSLGGEYKWHNDEIDGAYVYYYYPDEQEILRVHDEIYAILGK